MNQAIEVNGPARPIMAGIYTLISLIGCDELKVPLLFVIVHHL